MYLYFSADGSLKEIITEKVFRQGDSARDMIYIYVDGMSSPSAGWVSFRKPDGSKTDETQFYASGSATKKMVGKELPLDPPRNLKYFNYEHTYTDGTGTHAGYMFYQIEVPDAVLESSQETEKPMVPTENNLVVASVRFVFANSSVFKIGDIPFSVETSAGILTDYQINYSQYNYLLSLFNGEIMVPYYVPYNGATQNVNLGNRALMSDLSIGVKGSTYTSFLLSDRIAVIDDEYYGAEFLFPITDGQETIATKEEIEDGTIVARRATNATNTNFTNSLYVFYLVGSHGSVSLPSGNATYHIFWASSAISAEAENVNFGIVYVGTGTTNAFGKDVSGNEYILYLIGNNGTLYKKEAGEDEFSELSSGIILAKEIK